MYVCVCERERERERESIVSFYVQRGDVVLFEREGVCGGGGKCYEEEEDEVRVRREGISRKK